jgi:hypothetical protein
MRKLPAIAHRAAAALLIANFWAKKSGQKLDASSKA